MVRGEGELGGWECAPLLGLLRRQIQMLFLRITSLSASEGFKTQVLNLDLGFLFSLLGLHGYCTESD